MIQSKLPVAGLFNARRKRLLILIFLFQAALSLIVYSGRVESGDSLQYFDAVGSLIDFGDQALDISARQNIPQTFNAERFYPLEGASVEPMQILVGAPLYALAKAVPGLGLVHTVWLTNVLVSAASCVLIACYAFALGADERSAAGIALLLGTCTILLPYSKSFFREPLLLFWLLLAALLIERLRAYRYRSVPLIVGVFVALIGLTLTKASSLLALPALIVLALPPIRTMDRRWVLGAGGALIVIAAVFTVFSVFDLMPGSSGRYNLFARLARVDFEYFRTAAAAYLLSPGGSIWGSSPILLLVLPGIVLGWRRSARIAVAVPLLILSFALGYAAVSQGQWFGGLSLPPRFLVPVVGVAMIGALPVVERLTRRSRWWIIVVPLIALSVWVQFTGVSLWWGDYGLLLPPESNGLIEWGGGLYDWNYLRPVAMPRLWGQVPWDFAWQLADVPLIPILLVGIAIVCLTGIIRTYPQSLPSGVRRWHASPGRVWIVFPAIALILVTGFYLRLLHDRDGRYLAGDTSLHEMLTVINRETRAGDVILLSSPRYESFFLNYGKVTTGARVIVLPQQPGERPSPEQPALIESENPDALLMNITARLLYNLAIPRERLWLLVDGGFDLWWSVRPVERWMSAHHYPLRTWATSPITRLLEYSTARAPDPYLPYRAGYPTDLRFGDSLYLEGLAFPDGLAFVPGAALPVSLYWRADSPLTAAYTVALFLRDANGNPVAQNDSQPGGGFAPTFLWQPGRGVWDHRALRLPAELAPGRYALWVKVYDFAPDRTAQDLPVTGAQTLEDVIGVLPIEITVVAP